MILNFVFLSTKSKRISWREKFSYKQEFHLFLPGTLSQARGVVIDSGEMGKWCRRDENTRKGTAKHEKSTASELIVFVANLISQGNSGLLSVMPMHTACLPTCLMYTAAFTLE